VLHARLVEVAPHPLVLARALADRPGFCWLWSATGGVSYLACDPIETSHGLDPEPALALQPHPFDLGRVPRWVGLLPYEARRELERRHTLDARPEPELIRPVWQRYPAVLEVGDRVRAVGDDLARVLDLARRVLGPPKPTAAAALRLAEPIEPPARHAARVRRALDHIAKGDVYVVNLARRMRLDVKGHPLEVLLAMNKRAPAPYSAALCFDGLEVVSTSPELFLRTHPDGRVATWPIKGTRPRGADAESDHALAVELEADPKERAELAMVVDVERNDLGRVAVTGSVRLPREPRVETHGPVHHRVARLAAHLRSSVTRTELLEAMLPSGSVTGAPKIRAMELIAELEAHRRGLYTGAFGMLRHDGSLELAMAIRTLTVREGAGSYFAGGGIVADSDPEREVEETDWKAHQVLANLT